MKTKLLLTILLLLLTIPKSQSQNNAFTYTQFDFSTPLKPNLYSSNEPYSSPAQEKYWYLPDGINFDAGYGVHFQEFLALGAHFGLHTKASDQLVYTPVYVNFRIAPKIGHDTRIVLQTGYGKAFTYGRGNNHGSYFKMSLGFQSDDDLSIFIEINSIKGLHPEHLSGFSSFNIGVSLINLLSK